MNIAYMGTPDFAVPALQRLIESPHDVRLVVTQPSKRKGRGQKLVDPPVKTLADEHGIDVLQPASLRREPIEDEIRKRDIDVIVVAAYGQILPKSLLDAARIGCINIHASLLPAYRGAAPIQRALMDGVHETGVTIMKMVPKLDAGPMISQQRVDIEEDDDALSLTNMLAVLGADMLMRALDDVERDRRIDGIAQDDAQATYAPMISKEEGWADWALPSVEIMYRLRGLTPWPGYFTMLGDKRLRIIQAEPLLPDEAAIHARDEDIPPGTVAGIMEGYGPIVRTGDGFLLLTAVQIEGKPQMSAAAFLRGNPIEVGRKFGAPPPKTD